MHVGAGVEVVRGKGEGVAKGNNNRVCSCRALCLSPVSFSPSLHPLTNPTTDLASPSASDLMSFSPLPPIKPTTHRPGSTVRAVAQQRAAAGRPGPAAGGERRPAPVCAAAPQPGCEGGGGRGRQRHPDRRHRALQGEAVFCVWGGKGKAGGGRYPDRRHRALQGKRVVCLWEGAESGGGGVER